MGLSLLAGPANAGKVALLLDRYLGALDREPVLIVPTRSDVARVERELLARRPLLLGGTVGTFDDVFARLAVRPGEPAPPVATELQQTLLLRRAVAGASLNGLGASARSAGFVEALRDTIRELESNLVEPTGAEGDLARLYRGYRDELERFGLVDRELVRARAVERLANDLDAWHGEPVFAYGFEDLTQVEWRLLEALAGRTDVVVSLPYEPGRPAFASLRRTAEELASLAAERVEELPPAWHEVAQPAIAHVERALFADTVPEPPPIEGAVRFFEGAGMRGALELVAEEILDLVRDGTAPELIGVVAPNLDRVRAPLETAFATLGIPYGFGSYARFDQTPYGHALLSLLAYAWRDGGRLELFA
jgi:ATP-dependent helicase/DNAse subunit B